METIKEARELTNKYLEPIVQKHGFGLKVNAAKEAKIERKSPSGIDSLDMDMLNYTPSFRIRYAFSKVNNRVNSLLIDLQKRIALPLKEDKKSTFVFFSYNTLHNPTETTYLPFMETEAEVQACVDMMGSFIEETAIPLLARLDDLGEVDRIINGDEPWETDWHKPYVFGGNFHLKRLIVSRLGGRDSYDRVFEFVSSYLSAQFEGQYGNNFKARMAEVEALHRMLEEMKPVV
jgi:hypothetical protein